MTSAPVVVVDVWSDVACPFAHVGIRRFVERRAAAGRTDVVLRFRAWPLEVVNGEPLRGGHVAEKVAALRAQVAPELFAGFRPQAFPSTSMPAFGLTAAATRQGLATGEVVGLALRTALFEEGLDVADPAVLADVARRFGVPRDAHDPTFSAWTSTVADDHAEGVRRGVVGSPHVVLGHTDRFCPLLTITRTEAGLTITQDVSVIDALLSDAAPGTPPPAS